MSRLVDILDDLNKVYPDRITKAVDRDLFWVKSKRGLKVMAVSEVTIRGAQNPRQVLAEMVERVDDEERRILLQWYQEDLAQDRRFTTERGFKPTSRSFRGTPIRFDPTMRANAIQVLPGPAGNMKPPELWNDLRRSSEAFWGRPPATPEIQEDLDQIVGLVNKASQGQSLLEKPQPGERCQLCKRKMPVQGPSGPCTRVIDLEDDE